MTEFQSAIIHRISETEGESRGYYRFLQNENVTEANLINALQKQCEKNLKGERILVFCDTCTINLSKKKNRIVDKEGLYNIGQNHIKTNESTGVIIHPLLVYDRELGIPKGIANVKIIDRPVKGNKRPIGWNRKSYCIEEKENYKWIAPCLEVMDSTLSKSRHQLFVMDREADVIDVFDKLLTSESDVLVRSNYNRRIKDKNGKIWKIKELMSIQDSIGTIEVEVRNKKRKKRKAKLDVKIAQAEIQWPAGRKVKNKIHVNGIKISLIKVTEVIHKGCKHEPPLEWTLICTELIDDIQKAIEIIGCYQKRWKIEVFFKLMKTDGFDIESTELTKGKSIRKLILMIMKSSVKILQLKSARQEESQIKITEVFDNVEIECLTKLNGQFEGSTKKQQNPYDPTSLSWATWIIARLGGWKEFYNKERPPGNKTLVWGLEKFESVLIGFNISKIKDVS